MLSGSATSKTMENETLVNDFSIEVATVNGSGSQTANNVLMRTFFQMGVPVTGKNLFPSNIAGLPTWFQIRASRLGYQARKQAIDFMVCMNPETAKDDVAKVGPRHPGGLRRAPAAWTPCATTCTSARCPSRSWWRPAARNPSCRSWSRTWSTWGWPRRCWALDMDEVKRAIAKQLQGKQKAIELNQAAVQAGYDWAETQAPRQDRLRVERDNKTEGQIIIDGNSACALGAMFAGVTVVAWYPITPSSSAVESLIDYAKTYRKDPVTGS